MPTASRPALVDVDLPAFETAEVVVSAPGNGPGNWAGAPSAVVVDGTCWLAYRVRRPIDEGRGVQVIVAASPDGVHFEPVAEVHRHAFGAASLERPVLITTGEGADRRWRLYLSCASPDSKHWWIEALEAGDPADLAGGERFVVLPGSASVGVKDPVIRRTGSRWEMWVCCHPLDVPGAEDRMSTTYLTSGDGLTWQDQGTVLTGSPGSWDERGARVTSVLAVDPLVVTYDGRDSAAANWFEQTGLAVEDDQGTLVAQPEPVASSPVGTGALRYVSTVAWGGRTRFYFEASRADGAHDLLTSVS